MPALRRILVTVAIAATATAATVTPAAAHSVSGVTSTNYRTRLLSVRPDVPGIRVEVIEAGSRMQLTNTTDTDVIVFGYQDEPYLRVGPRGVFENQRSPATFLNADRSGSARPPASADPSASPRWEQVSSGTVARWHDHRAHFMGDTDPPQVRDAPDREHVVIPRWTVPFDHGATRIVATGDLTWVPGPSPLPWAIVAAVLAAVAVAVALASWWAAGVAVLVVLLVGVDVAHNVGIALAEAGSTGTRVARVVGGGFYSVLAWAAGVLAVVALLRRRAEGLFAVTFCALVVLLFGGLADLSNLYRSQIPFAWDADLARAAVTVSLGLGVGLTVASVMGIRRHVPLTVAAPGMAGPPSPAGE